jgi:predicted RecA/RadA family phage recombinase
MTNYICPGNTAVVVVPSATTYTVNQFVLEGQKLMVVYSTNNNTASAATGETVTMALEGVYQGTKPTTAGSGGAMGAFAYWIPSTGKFTADSTVSGAVKIGSFFATCADGDTICQIKLFPA